MNAKYITLLTAVIFGLGGYFLGNRNNPSSELYHALLDAGYSDSDIKHLPRSADAIISYFDTSDHNTGVMSLHVYRLMVSEENDEAKDFLVGRLANYYSLNSPKLHPDLNESEPRSLLISHIESTAKKHPELQAAITGKKNE